MGNNFNSLCRCGHKKLTHNTLGTFPGICWNYHFCKCKQFKLDNLKYLEQLYEANHK